ncbi:MAG: exodeoxyribonuclease VII large subunit [Propionibacteriaceae bacterium]
MPLESSPENPQPLRVVAQAVKGWVERLGPVWVSGQIIELQRRQGVTQFLTLRDTLAEVSVRLSTTVAVLDAAGPLGEGVTVAAWIKPTVWTKSGQLTYQCEDLRPLGEGRLLAQIEQRKRMLQAEGLFERALKKRLPFLPRRVGLITAKDSAAERDVVQHVTRRWPGAVIEIRYAQMQGVTTVEQVGDALATLDGSPEVDVIVIARGGGSLEDLLPFSDETLVRAVHAARTPIVSAIGHESDTPILDLVADARASTPTDAARLVVPDAAEEHRGVVEARRRLRTALTTRIAAERRVLADLRARPVLRDPSGPLRIHGEQLDDLRRRSRRAIRVALAQESSMVSLTRDRIRAMSPQATLARGYAILSAGDGSTVTRVVDLDIGDDLLAHLADGTATLEVRDVQPTEETDGPL